MMTDLHARLMQRPYRRTKPGERFAMAMVTTTLLPFSLDSRLGMLMALLAAESLDLIETDEQVEAATDLFRTTLKKMRHEQGLAA